MYIYLFLFFKDSNSWKDKNNFPRCGRRTPQT